MQIFSQHFLYKKYENKKNEIDENKLIEEMIKGVKNKHTIIFKYEEEFQKQKLVAKLIYFDKSSVNEHFKYLSEMNICFNYYPNFFMKNFFEITKKRYSYLKLKQKEKIKRFLQFFVKSSLGLQIFDLDKNKNDEFESISKNELKYSFEKNDNPLKKNEPNGIEEKEKKINVKLNNKIKKELEIKKEDDLIEQKKKVSADDEIFEEILEKEFPTKAINDLQKDLSENLKKLKKLTSKFKTNNQNLKKTEKFYNFGSSFVNEIKNNSKIGKNEILKISLDMINKKEKQITKKKINQNNQINFEKKNLKNLQNQTERLKINEDLNLNSCLKKKMDFSSIIKKMKRNAKNDETQFYTFISNKEKIIKKKSNPQQKDINPNQNLSISKEKKNILFLNDKQKISNPKNEKKTLISKDHKNITDLIDEKNLSVSKEKKKFSIAKKNQNKMSFLDKKFSFSRNNKKASFLKDEQRLSTSNLKQKISSLKNKNFETELYKKNSFLEKKNSQRIIKLNQIKNRSSSEKEKKSQKKKFEDILISNKKDIINQGLTKIDSHPVFSKTTKNSEELKKIKFDNFNKKIELKFLNKNKTEKKIDQIINEKKAERIYDRFDEYNLKTPRSVNKIKNEISSKNINHLSKSSILKKNLSFKDINLVKKNSLFLKPNKKNYETLKNKESKSFESEEDKKNEALFVFRTLGSQDKKNNYFLQNTKKENIAKILKSKILTKNSFPNINSFFNKKDHDKKLEEKKLNKNDKEIAKNHKKELIRNNLKIQNSQQPFLEDKLIHKKIDDKKKESSNNYQNNFENVVDKNKETSFTNSKKIKGFYDQNCIFNNEENKIEIDNKVYKNDFDEKRKIEIKDKFDEEEKTELNTKVYENKLNDTNKFDKNYFKDQNDETDKNKKVNDDENINKISIAIKSFEKINKKENPKIINQKKDSFEKVNKKEQPKTNHFFSSTNEDLIQNKVHFDKLEEIKFLLNKAKNSINIKNEDKKKDYSKIESQQINLTQNNLQKININIVNKINSEKSTKKKRTKEKEMNITIKDEKSESLKNLNKNEVSSKTKKNNDNIKITIKNKDMDEKNKNENGTLNRQKDKNIVSLSSSLNTLLNKSVNLKKEKKEKSKLDKNKDDLKNKNNSLKKEKNYDNKINLIFNNPEKLCYFQDQFFNQEYKPKIIHHTELQNKKKNNEKMNSIQNESLLKPSDK